MAARPFSMPFAGRIRSLVTRDGGSLGFDSAQRTKPGLPFANGNQGLALPGLTVAMLTHQFDPPPAGQTSEVADAIRYLPEDDPKAYRTCSRIRLRADRSEHKPKGLFTDQFTWPVRLQYPSLTEVLCMPADSASALCTAVLSAFLEPFESCDIVGGIAAGFETPAIDLGDCWFDRHGSTQARGAGHHWVSASPVAAGSLDERLESGNSPESSQDIGDSPAKALPGLVVRRLSGINSSPCRCDIMQCRGMAVRIGL